MGCSYTPFYHIEYKDGMRLRNGKKINCFQSTLLYKEFVNLQNIYTKKTPLPYYYCRRDCYILDCFIYFANFFHNEFHNYPILYTIYKAIKYKIDLFIKKIEEDGYECSCFQETPLNELYNLKKLYNKELKYKKEIFFKLASRLNKDIALKIINMY